MKNIIDSITERMRQAFADAGYDPQLGQVTVSDRPDLCEYQCNGALAAAKRYKCAPILIAKAVIEKLDRADFASVDVVMPGFINLTLSDDFLTGCLEQMRTDAELGVEKTGAGKTVVIDYGGANVAKPLHIGHLRSAIIGESLKRIHRFLGYNTIGDVHLGDWGLQMGLIIAELQMRHPEWRYFDPDRTGEYPAEPPFSIGELEEVYPYASAKSKSDPDFADRAHLATVELQKGRAGYRALWKHIMQISVADLRKNYDELDVHFDQWLGESDAQPLIPDMVERIKSQGFAVLSDGAWVIPVSDGSDKTEIPPCILLKSDGSAIYATTDLATLVQRMRDWAPDRILYLTDKRQALHFEQVFRAARKCGIVPAATELKHIGFGTMNGRDGKPFKTRDGGVMRLEQLIAELHDFVRDKVIENRISEDMVESTAAKIALAALKYGDLSNHPTKDYIFDFDRFAAFEGDTGPYILYTIVRIRSILTKYGAYEHLPIRKTADAGARDLMLSVGRFSSCVDAALANYAPNLLCAYIYELAGTVNKFYHETRILSERDESVKAGYIALIALAKRVLETSVFLLGFDAPERM
ncbi:MAG: arginine--tRNA ligase [Clostridia bacterium]|nr:arginine--tRNA ligase [Clostridia bacterium]